ncbi:uncharacterized protein EV420DRAFT_1025347 [Desarmillaria tabescens]|uniref:Uncharacterized protein n=1 Tax=Armillaria tabescens TaxID=1929756 RepID=A0AA39JIK1_ARMTA|nr:uncharacterized protein EV420DRAFT_1025347 [Desarmillaria tabescens]KAK0443440.1 hypothetical protein EV420DRAFT_1025347 [Desarmillaria tabescens]
MVARWSDTPLSLRPSPKSSFSSNNWTALDYDEDWARGDHTCSCSVQGCSTCAPSESGQTSPTPFATTGFSLGSSRQDLLGMGCQKEMKVQSGTPHTIPLVHGPSTHFCGNPPDSPRVLRRPLLASLDKFLSSCTMLLPTHCALARHRLRCVPSVEVLSNRPQRIMLLHFDDNGTPHKIQYSDNSICPRRRHPWETGTCET